MGRISSRIRDPLAPYKRNRSRIAKELGYSAIVLRKIEQAQSEVEIDNILAGARHKISDR